MFQLLILSLFLGVTHIKSQCVETPTEVSGAVAPNTFCSGDLIFEDTFDTFDQRIWKFEEMVNPYNNEFEYYTNTCCENTFIVDGVLYIKPSITADTSGGKGPITSARLLSINGFSWRYGRAELRAKTPTGDWLWPALWMMPTRDTYGGWPRSGEVDILETRGNTEYRDDGNDMGSRYMESTLHWGPDSNHNQYYRTHFSKVNASSSYNSAFHTFGLEWTPDHISWSVDGVTLGTITPPNGGFWELGELNNSGYDNIWSSGSKMAPFDQQFHFILNVAIGGDYFSDRAETPKRKPWSNGSSSARNDFWNARDDWLPTWNLEGSDDAALQIDYVRVWAL